MLSDHSQDTQQAQRDQRQHQGSPLCRTGCEILALNSGNHQELAEKDLCVSSLNYHRLKISGLWEITGHLQGMLQNGGCGREG